MNMGMSAWSIALSPSTADWRFRQLQREVQELAPGQVLPVLPVLTLAGPFTLKPSVDCKMVQEAIGSAGIQGPAGYLLDGWNWRRERETWVLGCTVVPSEELRALTETLHQHLLPFVGGGPLSPPYWEVPLVRTIDRELPKSLMTNATSPAYQGLLARLLSLVRMQGLIPPECAVSSRIPPLCLPQGGLRLTLLSSEQSTGGYDLVTQTWLNRYRSSARETWARTLNGYRESLLSPPRHHGPPYLISDLHLGHADIIQYCSRPFPDRPTMDQALIAGWNEVVAPGEEVLFLGDLCGSPAQVPEYLPALAGAITWVRGNHDPSVGTCEHQTLTIDGTRLLLMHDPADTPPGFDGWVVHGHTHNRRLHRYPFFSPEERTINVSAEVIGYRPVSLSSLVDLIRTCDQNLLLYSSLLD